LLYIHKLKTKKGKELGKKLKKKETTTRGYGRRWRRRQWRRGGQVMMELVVSPFVKGKRKKN